MKQPRALITVETAPGVFMRLSPQDAERFAAGEKQFSRPAAEKKAAPAKNKKAPRRNDKAVEPTEEPEVEE
jgi:hypothetical protein